MAPELTDEQLDEVKVHATAAAFGYHQSSVPAEQQVDLAASFAVHKDLRLVAADLLEAACLYARTQAATGEKLKRFRVEGEYEEEYFAGESAQGVSAEAWCAKAGVLRDAVMTEANVPGLIRSPVAGVVSGSNPTPVFRISRNLRETP